MSQLLLNEMGKGAGAAYVLLSLIVVWSALKNRGDGWRVGAVFATLTLSLPAWVGGLLWLSQKIGLVRPG